VAFVECPEHEDPRDGFDFGELAELLDDGGVNLAEVLGQLDEGERAGLDAPLDDEVGAGGIEGVLDGLADAMGDGEYGDKQGGRCGYRAERENGGAAPPPECLPCVPEKQSGSPRQYEMERAL
jgi:hypothetical protein